MPASATSTAWASRPRTADIEPVPAGAASAIALPRSTTALITCGASIAPPAARAAYSPTEWPAAATGSMPLRCSSIVRAIPTKHSAGCAFWVRRSSSSPAAVSRRRSATPANDSHRSHSAEISSSSRSSLPMPGCCEPWPGKRNATRGTLQPLRRFAPPPHKWGGHLLLGLEDLAARVVAAVAADRVWPLGALAVRAGLDLDQGEREVRAPATLLGLG